MRNLFKARRRLTISLVGIGTSLVLAGSAVFALGGFTATIGNTSNNYATGTIVLQENQSATTCLSTGNTITSNNTPCTTINLFGGQTNAVVGTTAVTTASFENIGTAGASTFTLTPAACSSVANPATTPYLGSDAAFCGKVDITIQNMTVPATPTCVYPAGGSACPAPSNTYTLTTLATAGPFSLGALASSTTDTYKITVVLDGTATNADQGLSASENLTWALGQ